MKDGEKEINLNKGLIGKTHNESICGRTQTEGDCEERPKKKGDWVQRNGPDPIRKMRFEPQKKKRRCGP